MGKRGILFTVNRTKTHKWATRVSDQVKKGWNNYETQNQRKLRGLSLTLNITEKPHNCAIQVSHQFLEKGKTTMKKLRKRLCWIVESTLTGG